MGKAEIVHYAVAPIHNLTLPRGKQVEAVGQFRIVKVRPWRYRVRRIPSDVLAAMRYNPLLQRWTSILREGYETSRRKTPKHVVYFFPTLGPGEKWMTSDIERDFEQASLKFDAFLVGLRLLKRGYVSMPGGPTIGSLVPGEAISAIKAGLDKAITTPHVPELFDPPYITGNDPAYSLRLADVEPLTDLVSKALQAFDTRLAIALRRFLHSEEGQLPDRFIDLLVTLEVLYGDQDPAAAGHKIAFRAAVVVGETAQDRTQVFRKLKKAYSARSGILHGRTAGTNLEDVGTLEEITRVSLRWFLNETHRRGRAPEGNDVDQLGFEAVPTQMAT